MITTKIEYLKNERAKIFLDATVYFQDDVYTCTCDLQSESAVFGADIYCHKKCIQAYFKKYVHVKSKSSSEKPSVKLKAFNDARIEIDKGLKDGRGYAVSVIRQVCNEQLHMSGHHL